MGERFLGVPVENIKKINSNNYDKLVIAELHGFEDLSQILSDMGVPEQKVVTFFPFKFLIKNPF